MFDIHTHILPNIDDGSRDVNESLAMLDELARQGVSCIAATPHFYAQQSSPERFFTKRKKSWEELKPHLTGTPEIRMGAEVLYFEGIQRYDGLEQFCIDGTSLLLVEMPTCTWTARMELAIAEINSRENMTVLLAHIERYLPYKNKQALERLSDRGVLMQVNANFFVEKSWTAMRMLRKGQIHFLGTDSHNMDSRKPNLISALEIIKRKKGEQFLKELVQREAMILNKA